MDLSRLSAKYAQSAPSANRLVEQNELYVNLADQLVDDGITLNNLTYLFSNPNISYITEKIMGANNVQYEKVITEEVEKYLVKEQSIDETINNIKVRGDKVILAD